MNILFIGDIVGAPGRRAVEELLPRAVDRYFIDLVVANGENASGGIGITPQVADFLLNQGVDVLTSGNHIWKHKEILPYLEDTDRLLRPANYPPETTPGRGLAMVETAAGEPVAIINLEGRVFMNAIECPFRTVDRLLESLCPGGEGHPGGHARRGHQRETGHGLAPGRPGERGGGHPHPRPDRG